MRKRVLLEEERAYEHIEEASMQGGLVYVKYMVNSLICT